MTCCNRHAVLLPAPPPPVPPRATDLLTYNMGDRQKPLPPRICSVHSSKLICRETREAGGGGGKFFTGTSAVSFAARTSTSFLLFLLPFFHFWLPVADKWMGSSSTSTVTPTKMDVDGKNKPVSHPSSLECDVMVPAASCEPRGWRPLNICELFFSSKPGLTVSQTI